MPVFNGTALNDTLTGTAGADTLNGLEGNDILVGDLGGDYIDGGTGRDTVRYSLSELGVKIDLLAATASGGEAQGDTLVSIEHVTGSNLEDVIRGDDLNNRLVGKAGNDTLEGRDGNDTIRGGDGADSLVGGVGLDLLSYSGSSAGVTVHLETLFASGGAATGDIFHGFEHLRGSDNADHLTGSNINNRIIGGAGDDSLYGLSGNDTLDGGAGADWFDGGEGFDVVTYKHATIFRYGAIIDVRLETSSGVAAGDQFTSIEGFVGTTVGDSFVLGDEDNRVFGHDGNDFIDAGRGDDTLIGGVGADFLHGSVGSDTAGYAASDAGISVNLQTGSATGGHATGDTLSWIENISGSTFDDNIAGSILDNRLRGSAGNDTLTGIDGRDTLVGGAGADHFAYVSRDDHLTTNDADSLTIGAFRNTDFDIIKDFTSGEDLLQMTAAEFSGAVYNTHSIDDLGLEDASDAAFAFHNGHLFHVRYETAADFSNGIVDVVHLARLLNVESLVQTDFDFV
ncbi:calcium-binding protein [Shimia thalassica]|uniref:calcium-binding protein n=1 Tax=Shimia thalassica TaxID=1715693 RepID=UPI001C08AB7C|nr:calcium-binding protein [Shimia thalassica]MBU2944451.1 hypothetical protein [Shimia thalassica]MDO6502203.1 calcium-binding protein [Shimia thalassica]